ncbi:unnamed protein product [Lampetra fluviatilis]
MGDTGRAVASTKSGGRGEALRADDRTLLVRTSEVACLLCSSSSSSCCGIWQGAGSVAALRLRFRVVPLVRECREERLSPAELVIWEPIHVSVLMALVEEEALRYSRSPLLSQSTTTSSEQLLVSLAVARSPW